MSSLNRELDHLRCKLFHSHEENKTAAAKIRSCVEETNHLKVLLQDADISDNLPQRPREVSRIQMVLVAVGFFIKIIFVF